jgi:hypothetical protein
MDKLFASWLALVIVSLAASTARADADSDRPHSIASISICSPTATGASVSCPSGTGDTRQAVLAPDGSFPLNNYGGLGTLADEHSTIFPPGTLPGHWDYLFFVATRTDLNPISSGVVALTGGPGPNEKGQWTLDFARDYGRYFPNSPKDQQNGQVFLSPVEHRNCPSVSENKFQDQTFDLNYADPGSIVLDPTDRANKGPGSLIMIYEGSNRCIGLSGGDNVLAGNSFYSTIAVATSNDFGHSWPSYRYMLDANGFPMDPVPSQNPSKGPEALSGATGKSVCIGNDCAAAPWPPDNNYGRYEVLHPQLTIADAMQSSVTKGGLSSQMGDAVPSAFVDDVHAFGESDSHDDGRGPLYLYELHNYAVEPPGLDFPQLPNGQNSDLMIARAQLNGGTAPLVFKKWYQGAFSQPGLGGLESAIFPSGAFENCEAIGQLKTMGSISYVEETQQYLLTFVCISPRGDPGSPGSAWFFSTNYDLSRPDRWSTPQEIVGSWSAFIDPKTTSCNDYDGWYPSFMSLHHKPGYLTTNGYVFYMKGCTGGGDTPGGREYSTRAFTIVTKDKGDHDDGGDHH